MKIRIVLTKLTLSWWLFTSIPSQSQSSYDTHLNTSIDSLMEAYYDSAKFNGTVLVAVSGKPIYRKAWGEAYLGMPLKEDTPFYLGSIAKQFTAMAVLMLIEEEKIPLDQTIDQYFPDLPSFTQIITIRNLLNHTSGLPDYYALGKFVPGMTNDMVMQVVQSLDSLEFTPGAQFSYSNTGYVLLSILVERVSGESFGKYVTSRIFEPLDMNHSQVYDGSSGAMPPHAVGHTSDGKVDDYQAFTTGGGGLFSQINDLFLWDRALHERNLISPSLLKESYTPAKLNSGQWSNYGFGWRLNEPQFQVVEHSGSLNGFRTYIYRDLRNQHTIILLSNFTNDVKSIKEALVSLLD